MHYILGNYHVLRSIAVGTEKQDLTPETLFTTSNTVGFYNTDFRDAVFYFLEGSNWTALILECQWQKFLRKESLTKGRLENGIVSEGEMTARRSSWLFKRGTYTW